MIRKICKLNGINPKAISGLKKRRKQGGTEFTGLAQPIKPGLRVRRPRVAEASAEAQAFFDLRLRRTEPTTSGEVRSFSEGGSEGGLKNRFQPK
jgi:hypothetical protein